MGPQGRTPRTIAAYQLVRLLGTGGMATVYEALHPTLGRRAAIKLLRANLCADPQLRARFFNEARAANLVQHPGVVAIFQHAEDDAGRAYIIMEYLAGQPLTQLIRAGETPLKLRLLRQIASAMAAVHARGVIHRDLKPHNIMVVPDPEVPGGQRAKILDFGVAKLKDQHYPFDVTVVETRLGALLGTPRYMSPEQCAGAHDLDEKADVYALGVMAYELLVGEAPFPQSQQAQLLHAHIHLPPPSLRQRVPALPPMLAELIHAALAKLPSRRPGMAEVAEALEPLIDPARLVIAPPSQERVTSRSLTRQSKTTVRHPATRAPPRGASHQRLLAVLGVAWLALLLCSALAWHLWR